MTMKMLQVSKTKMEEHAAAFKRCLNSIEADLSTQIQYLGHVCVGTAHQGTTFASQQRIALTQQILDSMKDQLKSIKETQLSTTKAESMEE